MRKFVINLLLVLLFFPFLLMSQNIPVVYAQGGSSWAEWKEYLTDEALWATGVSNFFNTSSSSTLANQGSTSYDAYNLKDWDPNTSWVEGESDYGIGEYFLVFPQENFDDDRLPAVFEVPNRIYNGYQKSYSLWIKNSRVKKFKIYTTDYYMDEHYFDGEDYQSVYEPVCYLILQDKMGGQYFDLPITLSGNFVIKFEIVEVYKGDNWSDVAITELHRVQH